MSPPQTPESGVGGRKRLELCIFNVEVTSVFPCFYPLLYVLFLNSRNDNVDST